MVAAFIDSVFVRKDVQQSLQTAANLLLMFLWEIFMIFPEKRWMHYVPSYIQDFLAAGLFMGSFGGAYMDLYYSFPAYDLVMHSVGGVFAHLSDTKYWYVCKSATRLRSICRL